jgi:hypothetical protein
VAFNSDHFRYLIVRPNLQDFTIANFWSRSAEELLMLTCAQETLFGTLLRQGYKTTTDARGVGLGPFSMEPVTFNWLRNRYHYCTIDTGRLLTTYMPEEMIYNLRLAVIMARLRYWVTKPPLPPANDIPGLAKYWDDFYNINPNAGFPKEAIDHYNRYVTPATK